MSSVAVLLFFLCLSLGQGLVPGKEDCVDVSRYEEVTYTTSNETFCNYKVEKQCTPQQQRVCATVSTKRRYLQCTGQVEEEGLSGVR